MLSLLVVLILFAIAGVLLIRPVRLSMRGVTAEGVVVGLVEDSEDNVFAPIVEFKTTPLGDLNERTFRFQHSIYENPPYKIGARVTVAYPQGEPERATIKSFTSLWLLPTVLLASGVLFLILMPFFAD